MYVQKPKKEVRCFWQGEIFGWEKENQKNERLFYSCFDSIIFCKRECIVLPNRQTQLIFVEESQKAVNCWGVGVAALSAGAWLLAVWLTLNPAAPLFSCPFKAPVCHYEVKLAPCSLPPLLGSTPQKVTACAQAFSQFCGP